jgi:hypothetical protein
MEDKESKMKKAILCAVGLGMAAGAAQAQLTETWDDPFGDWTGRWVYQNTNMENVYVASGNPDIHNRGNNPEGLWIASPQGVGNGDFTGGIEILIDPAFGATITDISFGLEAFIMIDVTAYDMDGVSLGTTTFSGGGFDFDHADIYSASSGNGVSRFVLASEPYGGGQVSGNTSIDNMSVTVPVPASVALLGLGGLVAVRRRR